ncbi:MAG: ABC transporter permease, partial [Chloroflexota bacterium]
MRSKPASESASFGLKLAALLGLVFLHFPLVIIIIYAFTTDETSFSFPLPGVTTKWFGVTLGRDDMWQALMLSLQVAVVATAIALVLGTITALSVSG